MSAAIRIALIGYGKIARDQHLPAITANPDFTLAAVIDPFAGDAPGVPLFRSIAEARASGIAIDAAALCNRPVDRAASARDAIAAGWHLLLEKPPGTSLGEVDALVADAGEAGLSLFTAWHSRCNPAVAMAAEILRGRTPLSVAIDWREDVDVWHPGQQWIWQSGGFGVFDPGINALSILTRVLGDRWHVESGTLHIPEGAATPLIARFGLAGVDRPLSVVADFDWSAERPDLWSIAITCAEGRVELLGGGRRLLIDGAEVAVHGDAEYPQLYAHFTRLIRNRASDVDVAPLRIALDALASGRPVAIAPR